LRIEQIILIPEIEDKLVWKHNIFLYELEEAFVNKPLFRFEKKGNSPDEHIYSAMSRTNVGRYVSIFFIYKRNRDALIISARDMTKKERQYYAKRKK